MRCRRRGLDSVPVGHPRRCSERPVATSGVLRRTFVVGGSLLACRRIFVLCLLGFLKGYHQWSYVLDCARTPVPHGDAPGTAWTMGTMGVSGVRLPRPALPICTFIGRWSVKRKVLRRWAGNTTRVCTRSTNAALTNSLSLFPLEVRATSTSSRPPTRVAPLPIDREYLCPVVQADAGVF